MSGDSRVPVLFRIPGVDGGPGITIPPAHLDDSSDEEREAA